MPSNKTNSATTPGRARIALAALAAMSVIAALLLGGLVALAQGDRGAVPNLRLSSASPGELTISWDAPDPAPSDYRVIWAEQSLDFLSYSAANEANRGNEYPGGAETTITLTGLTKGATFKVKARTRYAGGGDNNGPWSGSWTATATARVQEDPPPEPQPTPASTPQPPAAPTGLTTSGVAHDSVTVSWTTPSQGSVTGYRILRGTDSNSLSAIVQNTDSTATEYTDSTVTAETTYYYAVLALSAEGDGAQSAAVSATTPAAPQQTTVSDLRLSSTAAGQLTISWDAPDPAPSDYRVIWAKQDLDFLSYSAANEANRGNEYPGGDETSITITGLSGGSTFKVKARTRYTSGGDNNGAWSGPWTDTVTARVKADPPAAPTGLTASQVAHDSVTLTWTAPSSVSTVTGYKVLRGTDANSLSAIAQDTGSAGAEYTDSTVAAETTYYYAVLALSADGDGAQSNTASATTPAAPKKGKDNRVSPRQTAQTVVTLVSNSGTGNTTSRIIAQGFMTGSNPGGYTVSDVQLGIPFGGGATTVKIREDDDSDEPGDLVATFASPDTLSSTSSTFTAPANTDLDPDTHYWITVDEGVTSNRAYFTTTSSDDESGLAGWTIDNVRLVKTLDTDADWLEASASLVLTLRGTTTTTTADTTAPSFESAAANGTSLVITFDEDLVAASSLANSAFTVKKTPSGGSEATVSLSTTTGPVISGKTVTLTLGTALVSTDGSVKVTYTKPTTGTANKLVDAAANATATFTDQPVTNNTPALPVITIAAGTSPVTEGTAAAFTLTRTGSATADLSVNVTVSESGDMVASANEGAKTATFTANSATATLSVATVGDSVDEANSVVTATVTAIRATYTVGTPASATVTVQDNDTRGVTVSAATLTVNEGSTGTYTVKLDSQPTASVTVTPSKTGSSDVTFAPASLTFTTLNWSATQTVTVTAADDSDAADDTATISHAVAGGDYGSVTAASVVVTVDDDETADTTAPAFESAAANGTSLVITFDEDLVAASSLANSAFTVKKTPSGGSEATVSLSTTTGPVISGKTVTLTLGTALVSTDGSVKVTYTKPTTGTANKLVDAAANATATFTDQPVTNNTPALPVITIAAGTSPVTEGTAAAFTLTRTGSATADLSVNVTVSESGDMVASANEGAKTATFTANSATATLSVATVGDSVDEANSVVTATVTAIRATYTVGTPASATVTVQDNDTRGVTVSAATLTVNEGSTGTYTVKLDSQPTASVTVTPSKTGSSDVTFAPASLTFTTLNWSATQTVTVTAADDSDAADDTATISHAVAGGDYGSVTAASVVVTVDDDETADTTAPAFESAAANGTSLVITFDEDLVAASSLANSAFTVKKTPSGGSEATVSLSTTTGPVISGKTVTLTLGTALVSTDGSVKVTYTKPTTGTANKLVDAAANATATFTDQPVTNNTPALPVITIAAGTSPVTEGTAAAFTLTRTGSATADLSVNVTVSESGDMVASANEGAKTATFTANSATATLSVATVGDSVDEANSVVTATVTAIRATYTVGTPASATVTVQDNDTRGVTVSAATLTVNEGSTGTYTVKLDSQPTASVTVTPSKTGSSDVTFAPASLTFTTLNWSATQTVTVTAADDSDAADDTATISHAVAGGDYGSVTAASVVVTVDDDETADTTAPAFESAAANGTSLVITFDEDLVAASSLANSAFTVKKTPSGGSEATVSLSTTTGPVISGKTVTLTLGTALVSTDGSVKVTYTKPTTGTANKLVDAAANATATFTDQPVTNNTPALPVITIAAGTSPVTEGTAAAFTLTRTGSATADLSVNVTVSESGDMVASANEGAKTATFTANSATATLSVATVGDSVDEANSVVTATVTAIRATYTVGTPASATVTVQDNDTRGVTVSAATLTVNEGSTGTYTVKLDSQPTASVTVTPSKTGSSDVTFAPASLTFTTLNWSATQTVTVTAADDSDAADDTATISHAVAGGDYGSVTAASVVVTVDDDETGGNNLPTSRSGTVTATEDTAFTLSESNFAFSDGDSGDTLASVKITELPAAGKGTLALDGTAITSSALPKTVTKAELDASKLKYTPPANGYGTAYTSFKFKVNDGTADSAAAYTMTINVTNVSDPATGRPTISGTTTVGLTLTASTSGISDPDGLPNTFRYQWKRFAANGTTFEANIGANSNRYTLTEGDAGKRLKVEVSFTDNGGNREGPLLSAATATVQRPSSGSLSVGGLGAYWHDNHDNGGNLLRVDSCSGGKRFQVIWAGPEGNRSADEWDAEITDRGGARTLSHSFRETPGSPGNFEMTGIVNFTGSGTVTFRVQGRFGSAWGTWSPKASLYCFENQRERE